jgi:hypothetical protein
VKNIIDIKTIRETIERAMFSPGFMKRLIPPKIPIKEDQKPRGVNIPTKVPKLHDGAVIPESNENKYMIVTTIQLNHNDNSKGNILKFLNILLLYNKKDPGGSFLF